MVYHKGSNDCILMLHDEQGNKIKSSWISEHGGRGKIENMSATVTRSL